ARPEVLLALLGEAQGYNQKDIYDPSGEKQIKPRLVIQTRESKNASGETVQEERYRLSEEVRKGELVGFLEILKPDPNSLPAGIEVILRYQSNNPTYADFSRFAESAVTKHVRTKWVEKAK